MSAANRSPHVVLIPGYTRVTVQPQVWKRWSFLFVDWSLFYLFFVPHPLLSPPIFKSCSLPLITSQPSAALSNTSPQKVNFTSCYKQHAPPTWNEVKEFFKLPQEDFETCDLLKWWVGHAAQFPNLSKYTRDLFGAPGLWVYLSIQIHSTDCLLKGLLLLLSVYSPEEGTQSLYDALICSLRQFAHLCLWSNALGLLTMPSLKLLVTRTVYFDIVHLIGKFCVLY